jgi:hypothetical protein
MAWGAREYLVGIILLGILGVLVGCSGGGMFAVRESWRHDAEVECIEAGMVREGPGAVRIRAIQGPGICGADYPLRVSMLGGDSSLGYTDDPRPPAAIPGASNAGAAGSGASSSLPRWPVRPNAVTSQDVMRQDVTRQDLPSVRAAPAVPQPGGLDEPLSIVPPNAIDQGGAAPGYDYRRPYGERSPPSPPSRPGGPAGSLREDYSPVPYERRGLIDAPARQGRGPPPGAVPRDVGGTSPRLRTTGAVAPSIGPVAVSPNATLACPIVSVLDHWIASSVQPAAMRWFGVPVVEITQISAYSCRGMNGDPRAQISEHAFGNALDISAFRLADGRKVTVRAGWHGLPEEQGFLRDIQAAACDQFTTVLAPGSNVYHYDHMHVDLMRRSSGHRACNPQPVSGEAIAARAGGRYAGRRLEPGPTGSVGSQRTASAASKRSRLDPDEDTRFQSALPLAEPGNDGED